MHRPNSSNKLHPSKRATIKDVAAEADVSISTVSLVINNKDGVSDNTRERVLKAARRLHYTPSQSARQLASQKTGNIGFVLRESHFTRSEPFYTRIFLGTEFEARLHELYVLLTTIPNTYTPGKHTPRFLRERNIDGLIVAGKVDEAFLDEAHATGIPIVLVDLEAGPLPSVVIDNQQGARQATDHLIERGHRHIAFIGADLEHPSLRSRQEGYQLALSSAGIALDPERLITTTDGEPTRQMGRHLAQRLVNNSPRPTAAFCVNDAVALGVMDHAKQTALSIPGDLAIVGFDDVPGALHASPPLTTVRVYKEQLGELALRHLVERINGESDGKSRFERGGHSIKVKTELVVRSSS